jgi:hypothetical protein
MTEQRTHELKCWPPHWFDVASDVKRVEIRKDDRNYQVGDVLVLREWDPDMKIREISPEGPYTGRSCRKRITHILRGGQFGLINGYVALSLVDA